MIRIKSTRRPPAAPLSAMSDIGFLLLIFIMLISLINYRQEEKIEYPEAKRVEKIEADHELEIWVDARGAVKVEGRAYSAAELEQLISRTVAEQPDTRIQILADRNTPYAEVDQVIQLLQVLQHRVVGFVVREDL